MLSRTRNTIILGALVAVPLMLAAKADSKKYQVTGKVIELTDKTVVIQKDDEKWEIGKTDKLKVEGELKVGAKATVYYHMVADSAEVK